MSESYKVAGIVKISKNANTASGFVKHETVITTSGQYPQDLKVEWLGEKGEAIGKTISEGQSVEVEANVRGSEYNGKHYVSLAGWKILSQDGGATSSSQQTQYTQATTEEEDDIPFSKLLNLGKKVITALSGGNMIPA